MCVSCKIPRRWLVLLAVGGGLLFVFGFLPSALVTWISKPGAPPIGVPDAWQKRQFIIQTIAGNWSPPDHTILEPWWFAFFAILAVVLNYGPLTIAIGYLWTIWRRRMVLAQAFVTRDQMNKQALYDKLGADEKTMQTIREAFSDGEKQWEEHLIAVFGEHDAKKLRALLSKEI